MDAAAPSRPGRHYAIGFHNFTNKRSGSAPVTGVMATLGCVSVATLPFWTLASDRSEEASPEDDPITLSIKATVLRETAVGLVPVPFPFFAEKDPIVGIERLPNFPFGLLLQLKRQCLRDGLEDGSLAQRKPSCHQNQHIIYGRGSMAIYKGKQPTSQQHSVCDDRRSYR